MNHTLEMLDIVRYQSWRYPLNTQVTIKIWKGEEKSFTYTEQIVVKKLFNFWGADPHYGKHINISNPHLDGWITNSTHGYIGLTQIINIFVYVSGEKKMFSVIKWFPWLTSEVDSFTFCVFEVPWDFRVRIFCWPLVSDKVIESERKWHYRKVLGFLQSMWTPNVSPSTYMVKIC